MWIALALVAALASAATTLTLKRTLAHGPVVATSVAYRAIAGVLLCGLVVASTGIPTPNAAYWRVTALVMGPEVAGMLCLTLALRHGELSLVQPLFGLLPLFVVAGGAIFLDERPSGPALVGIGLVAAGIYVVGLQPGGSLLDPLRALGRTRASWYAVAAAFAWAFTTVLHRVGVDAIGALPWAATLTLGSAIVLALALPFVRRDGTAGQVPAAPFRAVPGASPGGAAPPPSPAAWRRRVALAGLLFTAQQVGLMHAFGIAPAAYVAALTATSTLLATLFAVVVLRERAARRERLVASALVTAGAAMVALYG